MNKVNEQRLEWLDAVKGFGIILVLIGHSGLPGGSYIYMFHMPLFFIISGFCWNKEKYRSLSFKDFFKKKFNGYIIPYLKVSTVCFIVYGILWGIYRFGVSEAYMHQLLKYLFGILIYSRGTTEWLPNCSPIWFLSCLFVAEIIYWYANKYEGTRKVIIIITVGLIGIAFSHIVKLPWNIDNACSAVPLIFIGTVVKNQYDKLFSIKLIPLYLIASISIFLYGVKGGDFDGNNFPNFPLMYLQTTAISICVLTTFRFMGGKILPYFGRNTLILIGYNYTLNFLISPFTGTGNIWMMISVIIGGFILIYISNKIDIVKKNLI